MKQPGWVRTFTYLIFAILLVVALYRLIGGEFSVRGRVLQQAIGGFKPAKNHDVRIRDKFFGTSSRGIYYVILSPSQYYKLMAEGNLTLGISKGEEIFPPRTATFNRFDQEFEDIILPRGLKVGHLGKPSEFELSLSNFLTNAAWAGDPIQANDRLFVTALQLKPNLPRMKEGELKFRVSKDSLKLSAVQTRGLPAGLVPLISGKRILLETDYYFKIPQNLTFSSSDQIKLSTKGRIFSTYSETFAVSKKPKYGEIFTSIGEKGSKMDLLLLSAYDVVIWRKKDLEDVEQELESQFFRNGFRVVKKRSPLGYKAQTNALFGGNSVPFTILQRTLGILTDQQIKIKTIQYQSNLRSGNPYEIQVGGFYALNYEPEIPVDKLKQLKGASTEEEFKRVLKKILSGKRGQPLKWNK